VFKRAASMRNAESGEFNENQNVMYIHRSRVVLRSWQSPSYFKYLPVIRVTWRLITGTSTAHRCIKLFVCSLPPPLPIRRIYLKSFFFTINVPSVSISPNWPLSFRILYRTIPMRCWDTQLSGCCNVCVCVCVCVCIQAVIRLVPARISTVSDFQIDFSRSSD
jgi:hypothetical protein